MENASKALTIAAGMLFSVLIIGIVVMAFRNISELQGEKQSLESSQQALGFNQKFDSFIRDDLSGVEMISVANQIDDYNNQEEDSALHVDLEVTLSAAKQISGAQYMKPNTYDQDSILTAYNGLTNALASYTNKTYANGKTIDYFTTLRSQELRLLIQQYGEGTGRNNVPTEALRQEYEDLKTEMNAFKRKIFSCTAEYSSTTGRVSKMIITEV